MLGTNPLFSQHSLSAATCLALLLGFRNDYHGGPSPPCAREKEGFLDPFSMTLEFPYSFNVELLVPAAYQALYWALRE